MKSAEGKGGRRAFVAVVLFVAVTAAIVFAWQQAFKEGNELLFNRFWWLVIVTPFVGIGCASITKRHDPEVIGDKVLRHDDAAILEHWTHGIGTVMLLVSGIALGCLFIPNLLSTDDTNAMMNVHFVGVLVFLFGTFYYMGNSLLSPKRVREHFPTKNMIGYTKRHYGLLLGFKKFTMPPEEKYFESERAAFIMAVVTTLLIILTGILKTLAHVLNIPDVVMDVSSFVHDLMAIIMVLFILPHVFFAVLAPGSFPLFISMTTGYLPLESAKKEHAGWLKILDQQGRGIEADQARGDACTCSQTAADASPAADDEQPDCAGTQESAHTKTDTTQEGALN